MEKEDMDFEALEKKIGAETIDIRKKDDICIYPKCNCPFDMGVDYKCLIGKKVELSMGIKRNWFAWKFKYYAKDEEVNEAWRKENE